VKYVNSSELNDDKMPKFSYPPEVGDFSSSYSEENFPLTITVVVDTEEEFDWNGPFDPENISVENIKKQYLAQEVFYKYGVIPTYVIDYPVSNNKTSIDVLKYFFESGKCEIGAHLHPWVTPPETEYLSTRYSYPGNLPEAVERKKIEALTAQITSAFGRQPTVYKAGRYGIGPSTMAILHACGYRIDTSVVPHTDFSSDGGPDFSRLSTQPLRLGPNLVEMPLSVDFAGLCAPLGPRLYPWLVGKTAKALHLPGIAARLGLLERLRLTPEGHTAEDMIRQVQAGIARGRRIFMLTYHSSSLLPGATPYVRTEADQQNFLATLDRFLLTFFEKFGGTANTVDGVARQLFPSVS